MARPSKERPPLAARILQPEVLPVDWLSVNLRVMKPSTQWKGSTTPFVGSRGRFSRFSYRRVQDGTRVWGRIDDLHDRDGQVIAQVASDARSAMLFDPNEIQVKVDNRALYDGRWMRLCDQLLLGEGWTYTATSQLDIAADGVGFLEPFAEYVRGGIEYAGKGTLHFSKPPNGPVDGFRLGSRQSGKYARCYYKREELAVSGKSYINDYWLANRIPEDRPMQRLEVSMKGGEIRRYFGKWAEDAEFVDVDTGEAYGANLDERDPAFLSALRDPAQRVKMYNSAMCRFVAFREAIPGARARDKRPVVAWDFSRISNEVRAIPRAPRVSDLGLNSMKTTIRNNYLCSRADGGRQYLSLVQQQVSAFGLQGWYAEKRPAWDAEFRKFVEARGMVALTLFDAIRLTMGDGDIPSPHAPQG